MFSKNKLPIKSPITSEVPPSNQKPPHHFRAPLTYQTSPYIKVPLRVSPYVRVPTRFPPHIRDPIRSGDQLT